MSLARRAPKRPAVFDADNDEQAVDNSCSVSLGAEAARVAGSAVTNHDVIVREESDAGSRAEGDIALDT